MPSASTIPDFDSFAAGRAQFAPAPVAVPPQDATPDFETFKRERRVAQPGAPPQSPSKVWTLDNAEEVKRWYRETFKRELPLSAFGESGYHKKRGLDHQESFDIALHPDSEEGRAVISHFKEKGYPFLAYDRAVPGAATAPHIHGGFRSRGLGVEAQPAGVPDFDTFLSERGAAPDLAPPPRARAFSTPDRAPAVPTPRTSVTSRVVEDEGDAAAQGATQAAPQSQVSTAAPGSSFEVPVGPKDSPLDVRKRVLEVVADRAQLRGAAREQFVSSWLNVGGKFGALDIPDEQFEEMKRAGRMRVQIDDAALSKMGEQLAAHSGGVVAEAGMREMAMRSGVEHEVAAEAAKWHGGEMGNMNYAPAHVLDPERFSQQEVERRFQERRAELAEVERVFESLTPQDHARLERNARDYINSGHVTRAVAEGFVGGFGAGKTNMLAGGARLASDVAGGVGMGDAADALRRWYEGNKKDAVMAALAVEMADRKAPLTPAQKAIKFASAVGPDLVFQGASASALGAVPGLGRFALPVVFGSQSGLGSYGSGASPKTATIEAGKGAVIGGLFKATGGAPARVALPAVAAGSFQARTLAGESTSEALPGVVSDVMFAGAPRAISAARRALGGRTPPTASAEESAAEAEADGALDVISFRGRDMIRVEMPDGSVQGFYRSTGRNSGQPGRWFPFDDVRRLPDGLWLNKGRFVEGELEDAAHPLHRLGTPELKAVSDELGRAGVPSGREVSDPAEVNGWLGGGEPRPVGDTPATEAQGMSEAQSSMPTRAGFLRRFDERVSERVISRFGTSRDTPRRQTISEDESAPLRAVMGRPRYTPKENLQRAGEVVWGVLNLPKAVKAAFDWSGIGRQGWPQILAHPTRLKLALSASKRATVSQGQADELAEAIRAHPMYERMRAAGVFLSSVEPGAHEEPFVSPARVVPGIKQSDRSYSATQDALRVAAAEQYFAELDAQPGGSTPKADRAAAELVNISTGRGVVPILDRSEVGRRIVNFLNLPLFSPRNFASKFNLISPYRIARNAIDPETRTVAKIQAKEAMRGTATLGLTLALLDQVPGVDVGYAPWRDDFLKVRLGKTSWDLGGGTSAAIRYVFGMADSFSQLANGKQVEEKKSPVALTRRYLRSQLSPPFKVAVDYQVGTTFTGKDFDWANVPADLLLPFLLSDMYEGFVGYGGSTVTDLAQGKPLRSGDTPGGGFGGALLASTSFFGPGVGTYESKEQQTDLIAHGEASSYPAADDVATAELKRLGIDVKRISASYGVESSSGDSIKLNGESLVVPKGKRDELDRRLHAAILEDVGRVLREPSYQSFFSDSDRRKYLVQLIGFTRKRVLNEFRFETRTKDNEKSEELKQRLERMGNPDTAPKTRKL